MLLGLLGLLCGQHRRKYVMDLSKQALVTASVLMHGPAVRSLPDRRPGPASRRSAPRKP
jgi:hypothetical protein